MHGRKRVKPSPEIERLRKEKEAVKINEYNELVDSCLNKKVKKEFDAIAFNFTTKILAQNPDFYTIWNFRRNILIYGLLKDATTHQKQETFSDELGFLQAIFKLNPKSYWIFNHRRWCLQNMPAPDWQKELSLVEKMLELDSRNFHGWDYRRYVASQLSFSVNTDSDKTETLIQTQFNFTTTKINQNFSNYSAWHQRSKMLPRLIEERNMDDEEKKIIIDKEFDLIRSAIYTDPDDQSAWLYHWWLVGREMYHISVLGAYFDPKEREIILAFDDEIGMMTPFLVTHGHEENNDYLIVKGKWRPAGGVSKHDQLNADRLYGFVWIFNLETENLKPLALTVTIEPSWIIPSHSEASLTHKFQKNVYIIDTGLELPILATTVAQAKLVETLIVPTLDTLPIAALERINLLKREINVIKELLELEPDSKWCLQALINLQSELKYASMLNSEEADKIDEEIVKYCDHLIKIDNLRAKRFEDRRSRVIFERKTRSLVQRAPEAPKEFVFSQTVIDSSAPQSPYTPPPQTSISFRSNGLTLIPTPSILLLIFDLDLSHNKLISMSFLANLINLREVNLSYNLISEIEGLRELRFLRKLNLCANLISSWKSIKEELINRGQTREENCKIHLHGNPINDRDPSGSLNGDIKKMVPWVEIITQIV
ncbi:hypothetical protein G9A89_019538 [Geosiphon pyriformis]|nr:hypothetical protein G9A89_019538 [Geosiphon pyriformis]